MSDSKTSLDVVVSADVRELLDQIAAERERKLDNRKRVYASDIVREAIQEYLQNHGHNIEVKVNRGGYRG